MAVFFAFSILFFCDVWADQNDDRLDDLFESLRSADTEEEAGAIEQQIWFIWLESGRTDVDLLMARGIQAMQGQHNKERKTNDDETAGEEKIESIPLLLFGDYEIIIEKK